MSKRRLQVLLEELEYREIQQTARRNRMTVAEWVRQALRDARKAEPMRDTMRKLDAVRVAVGHEFPTAEIEAMLAEIAGGYTGEARP